MRPEGRIFQSSAWHPNDIDCKGEFSPQQLEGSHKDFHRASQAAGNGQKARTLFFIDAKGNIHYISFIKFTEQRISFEEKKFIQKQLDAFAGVAGFTCSIESWLNMEEILDVLKKKKDDEQSG